MGIVWKKKNKIKAIEARKSSKILFKWLDETKYEDVVGETLDQEQISIDDL